jgi:hypothetical protein
MLRLLFSRIGVPHVGSPQAFSFNVPSVSGAGAVTSAGEGVQRLAERDVAEPDVDHAEERRVGGALPQELLFSRIGVPHVGSPQAFSFNVPSVSGAGAVTFEKCSSTPSTAAPSPRCSR